MWNRGVLRSQTVLVIKMRILSLSLFIPFDVGVDV